MAEKTSGERKMKSFRLSSKTHSLLAALAARLAEKDGIRAVTETEVVERAIHSLARKEGVK